MCNKKSIKEIKYNTKKKTTSYKEQCKEKVNKYLNEIKNFSEEDIVYIDETGIQGYIYREYARAIRGKKVYDKIPGKKYKRTNIVAGKCGDKIISPLVYDKIMDSKFFEKWFKEMFLNEVEKNKAIVMDNATFHCKSRLYELCKNANKNLKLIFLPPYSPNLNPIEKYWATLKKNLKKILEAEKIIKEKIISVEEIKPKKAVLITTGNEVYKGRIKDAFLPVMKEKLEYYGSEIVKQIILPDNKEMITENILKAIEEDKVDMIICTGGMSVDPDDVTPSAIKDCNGEIVTYGAPVLPGAMFLLAYYKNIPILGVPSCAMYSKRTIFDLVLPRILADEKLSFEDIARFGNGGMCLNCEICSFPHCSFGK